MIENSTKHQIAFIWPATDELKQYFHAELDPIADIRFCEPDNDESTIADADIIVGWAITESVLKAARKARLVIIPAIGVDRHIPILKKFPRIQAINSRGNAVPTAQHAIGLLLAATNYITHFDNHMRQGNWRAFNDSPPSLLLENVTIGILGTGTIGKEIIARLQGFGCSIVGCSRSGNPLEDHPEIPVYPVEKLADFLKISRILIIAVPNTRETNDFIGENEINLLPDSAIIVNIARGSVVNEQALYDALKSGKLMAAGIDVWYNYRPEPVDGKKYPYTCPFHQLPNVILSPHRASSPLRRPGRYVDVIENIKRFISKKPLTNRIDLDKGY